MRKLLEVLVATGMMSLPGLASATGPTLGDVLNNSGITINGHLSSSYTAGFNQGQALAIRAFNSNANSFEINQAMLTVARQPSQGVGALVNLLAGSDAAVVNSAYGNGTADFSVVQAYARYASGGLTIMGGRYTTLAGNEVINDSVDTNISRSILFQLIEPLVHTGVRASYALGSATFYLGVNNGIYSGNESDNNQQKALEAGVSLAPTSKIGLGLYDYYSHEGGAVINYADFVGSVQLTARLQFVLNADWYKSQPTASFAGGSANTYGLAIYLNYAFNDQWKGSLRGEYVKDEDDLSGGAVCPKPDGKCMLSEVTATVGYSPVDNFTVLAELRYDMGDRVYPNPGSSPYIPTAYTDTQGNIAVKTIYTF